jgi:transposase
MDTSPITIGVGNGAVLRLLLLPSAQRVAPPAQNQPPRARQAEFVICDQTIEIVRRYNAGGASGLGDQRARNTGARPLLSQEDEAALRDALVEPPTDGGLWTGPKVAAWMARRLGRKVWPQRGWDYLKRLEHSLQVPRPKHAKAASAEEQEAVKRGSRAKWTSAAPRTRSGRSRSGRSMSSASV